MDGIIIANKTHTHTLTPTLPHNIIINILSRLPVKSLLRFKSVSKQWRATISDPEFAETHLRQSKNPSSRQNLLAWLSDDFAGLNVVKLETNEFQELSAVEYPPEEYSEHIILCYCDGLFLKKCGRYHALRTYVLWNPSSRAYKKLECPFPIDYCSKTFYGICYDPLVKDYKLVVGDMKYYAIYYCRDNDWSDMKLVRGFACSDVVLCRNGVSCNGCIYWPLISKGLFELQIVCFDAKDEKFRKLSRPGWVKDAELLSLTCLGGHLCFRALKRFSEWNEEMLIMKKVGDGEGEDSWMEFKVRVPNSCPVYPLCLTNENEVIYEVFDRKGYILYNKSKDTFAEIRKSLTKKFSHHPMPYIENLFLL